MSGGPGASPPDWAIIYEIAKDLGVPPWQLEEECSREWWIRAVEYRMARAQHLEWLDKHGPRSSR